MDECENRDGCGVLPTLAPLAVPYVPYQQKNPERYTAKRGLIRGTLYPGLDLPFLGMVNETEKTDTPLHDLQALCFALQELALYLDTHCDDQEAAALYGQYAELYQAAMTQYQAEHGPLQRIDALQEGSYRWLCAPWPWEYKTNEEG